MESLSRKVAILSTSNAISEELCNKEWSGEWTVSMVLLPEVKVSNYQIWESDNEKVTLKCFDGDWESDVYSHLNTNEWTNITNKFGLCFKCFW